MSDRYRVFDEVWAERDRQDAKWGEQNHPNGTGHDSTGFRAGLPATMPTADQARTACEHAFAVGRGAWRDILVEEVAEALDEADPAALRAELVQVAAVAVAWVEKIDRDRDRARPAVDAAKLEEIDRNARAYGWEIGRGRPLTEEIGSTSENNPFLDPDWRAHVTRPEPDAARVALQAGGGDE